MRAHTVTWPIWAVAVPRKIATMLRMLGARAKRGFLDFLDTSAAHAAPPWLIQQLAAMRWPDDVEPTAAVFAGLQAMLQAASLSCTDRQAV